MKTIKHVFFILLFVLGLFSVVMLDMLASVSKLTFMKYTVVIGVAIYFISLSKIGQLSLHHLVDERQKSVVNRFNLALILFFILYLFALPVLGSDYISEAKHLLYLFLYLIVGSVLDVALINVLAFDYEIISKQMMQFIKTHIAFFMVIVVGSVLLCSVFDGVASHFIFKRTLSLNIFNIAWMKQFEVYFLQLGLLSLLIEVTRQNVIYDEHSFIKTTYHFLKSPFLYLLIVICFLVGGYHSIKMQVTETLYATIILVLIALASLAIVMIHFSVTRLKSLLYYFALYFVLHTIIQPWCVLGIIRMILMCSIWLIISIFVVVLQMHAFVHERIDLEPIDEEYDEDDDYDTLWWHFGRFVSSFFEK